MFPIIDIKTIVIAIIFGNFFVILLLMSYSRHLEKTPAPIRLFTAAKWVQLIGWIILALRGNIPDAVSIYMGNILTITGGIMEMVAILQIVEYFSKRIKIFYISIGTLFFFTMFIAYFGDLSEKLRIANISIFLAVITLLPTIQLLKTRRPLHLMMGTLYSFTSISLVARAAYALTSDGPMLLFSNSWIQTWSFLALFMLSIIGCNGFVLLAKEKADEELVALASNDDLTHILNRRTFIQQSQKMLALSARKKTSVAVMIIDIDNFKKINDNYGHDVGDAILRDFSEKIVHNLRVYDLFGRYGGDEFSVLLPDTTRDNALEIAERFRSFIENSPHVGLHKINYTISIGIVALFPEENAEFDIIFKQADNALYEAKHSGRNKVSIQD